VCVCVCVCVCIYVCVCACMCAPLLVSAETIGQCEKVLMCVQCVCDGSASIYLNFSLYVCVCVRVCVCVCVCVCWLCSHHYAYYCYV